MVRPIAKKTKKRSKKSRHSKSLPKKRFQKKDIFVYCLYLIGALIALYPVFSNLYYKNIQNDITKAYYSQEGTKDPKEIEKEKEVTKLYNEELSDTFAQSFDMPDFDTNPLSLLEGVDSKQLGNTLGVVSIPKIQVKLPIYHGTNEAQLKNGAGLIKGTSLPGGGESTHSIVTAHRGLPSAKLFTDLPKLEIGDYFFIETLGEKLAYKVNDITVIKPEEIEKLKIVPGKDYVTLLTCTPYMINTHRLLVRGEATEYRVEDEQKAIKQGNKDHYKKLLIGALIVILVIGIIIWLKKRKSKRNKKTKKRRKK